MEFYFLVGVIISLFAAFSIFILPFIVFSLSGRIRYLEQTIHSLVSDKSTTKIPSIPALPQTKEPISFLATLTPTKITEENSPTEANLDIPKPISIPPNIIATPNVVLPSVSTPFFPLYNWLKQDFFVKLGGLFVILAGVWFVSYAFANDIIGEQGRVSLGLLAGCLLLGVGYWQLEKRNVVGTVITVTGSTTLIASLWSATVLYGLFTPTIAFSSMVLTLALTILISVIRKNQFLAVFSLITSYLVPFLTGSQSEGSLQLFIYLIIVSIAMYSITYFTKWRILQTISMVALALFSPLLYADQTLNPWLILIPSIALMYGTSITSILRSKSLVFLDILNSAISTFLMNIWVIVFIQQDLRVITLSLIAVGTFGLSLLFYKKSIGHKLINIQLVSSVVVLTIATCIQLYEQPYILAIAIALEIVGIQWLLNKTLSYTNHFVLFSFGHILPYSLYISQRVNEGQESLVPYLISTIILGLILNLNSILIQFTTLKITTLHFKTISSLLTAGSLVYAGHFIFGFVEYIIQTIPISSFTVANGIYPLLALTIAAIGLIYIYLPVTSSDKILRTAGNIITIFGLGFFTSALTNTSSQYTFIYLLGVWIISGFMLYKQHFTMKKEITVYSIIVLIGSFLYQIWNVLQDANDLMKILFYLVYISLLLFWITKPSPDQQSYISVIHKILMGTILFLLVFVELWSIGIIFRIITFIIIGLLFISTGFLKKPNSK